MKNSCEEREGLSLTLPDLKIAKGMAQQDWIRPLRKGLQAALASDSMRHKQI